MKRRLPVLVENAVLNDATSKQKITSAYDRETLQTLEEAGMSLACGRGCSNCCYRPVSISILEGIQIFRHLKDSGQWTPSLVSSLKKASNLRAKITSEMWALSLQKCPLLDENNLCKAYANRPAVCHLYSVVSDPYYCHPHHLGESTATVPYLHQLMVYTRQAETEHRQLGIPYVHYPLPQALLLAAKVDQGTLAISAVVREAQKEIEDADV